MTLYINNDYSNLIYLSFIYYSFFNVVILTEYAYTLIWYYVHVIIGHT